MERLLEQATPEAIYLASDVGWFSVISLVGRITGTAAHFDICQSAANSVLSSMSATRVERVLASLSLALMAAQVADIGVIEEHWDNLESSRGKMLGAGNTVLVNADRVLGILAQTMGNLDESQAHFEEAIAFCRKAGYRPDLAWTCFDYASLRHTQGDRERALALLGEANVISSELGMLPLREKVSNLRQDLEAQPAASPTYPDGLTGREVEVLRLIAAGRTDREIADELFISIRTANTHVRNILNKTGSANRTEAATYAGRRDLV